jgi:hypothetical protein
VPADAAYSSDEDEDGGGAGEEDPRLPGRRAPRSDVRITQRAADRRRARDDEWSDSDDEGLGGRRDRQSYRDDDGEGGKGRKAPLPPMPMPVTEAAAMDADAAEGPAAAGGAGAPWGGEGMQQDDDGVPGL